MRILFLVNGFENGIDHSNIWNSEDDGGWEQRVCDMIGQRLLPTAIDYISFSTSKNNTMLMTNDYLPTIHSHSCLKTPQTPLNVTWLNGITQRQNSFITETLSHGAVAGDKM